MFAESPSWSAPLIDGGESPPPLDVVAELWRRRQAWEKRHTPTNALVSTFVSWEQLHPCRVVVDKLPTTLFDAIWPHASRAVVLYWSVDTKQKVVQLHGTVMPQRELGYQLHSRWDAPVRWNTNTHVLASALPLLSGARRQRPPSQVLGDIDYRRPLSINAEAAIAWMRRLREVDERAMQLSRNTPTALLPKQFCTTVRWLGDADARSGRALSFLLRLAIVDAERRGWPPAAADYVFGAHAALWRRYQQLFYDGDDDEATVLREVLAPTAVAEHASVRCFERDAAALTADEARAIYYHPSEEPELPFRPADELFDWQRELQRFVRSYPTPAPPLPTRCYVAPPWMFSGAPVWAHTAVLHYRDAWYWLQCAAYERLRYAIDDAADVDSWLARFVDSPTAWHRIRYALWDSLRPFVAADIGPYIDTLPRGETEKKKTAAAAAAMSGGGNFSADPYMRGIDREAPEEDVEAVRYALQQRAQEFVTHLMDGVGPSKVDNGGARLGWGTNGALVLWPDEGRWYNFDGGPGGSLIDLVTYKRALGQRARARNVPEHAIRGCTFRWALQYCRAFLQTAPTATAPRRAAAARNAMTPERCAEIVAHLWGAGESLATMDATDERRQRAAAYLCDLRGIRCWHELVHTTRWRFCENYPADGGRYPAIVCPLYSTTSPTTAETPPTAVHGLLLSHWSDGRTTLLRASKRTLGPMRGAAILAGGNPAATHVLIVEGPESALSAVDGLWPRVDDVCVYAVGGKSNLTSFEASSTTTDIYLVGDDDGGGAKDVLPLAQRLAARYADRHIRVYLVMPPPLFDGGKIDCNDWSRSFATAAAWRAAFQRALNGALCVEHVNTAMK